MHGDGRRRDGHELTSALTRPTDRPRAAAEVRSALPVSLYLSPVQDRSLSSSSSAREHTLSTLLDEMHVASRDASPRPSVGQQHPPRPAARLIKL